ncbi:MAG: hypothetical protein ACM37W_19565 [Actinomycetota bacterium]
MQVEEPETVLSDASISLTATLSAKRQKILSTIADVMGLMKLSRCNYIKMPKFTPCSQVPGGLFFPSYLCASQGCCRSKLELSTVLAAIAPLPCHKAIPEDERLTVLSYLQ